MFDGPFTELKSHFLRRVPSRPANVKLLMDDVHSHVYRSCGFIRFPKFEYHRFFAEQIRSAHQDNDHAPYFNLEPPTESLALITNYTADKAYGVIMVNATERVSNRNLYAQRV